MFGGRAVTDPTRRGPTNSGLAPTNIDLQNLIHLGSLGFYSVLAPTIIDASSWLAKSYHVCAVSWPDNHGTFTPVRGLGFEIASLGSQGLVLLARCLGFPPPFPSCSV